MLRFLAAIPVLILSASCRRQEAAIPAVPPAQADASIATRAPSAGAAPRDLLVAVTSRVYRKQGRSHDQIYLVRGDGSGLRPLTDTPRAKSAPGISGNGQFLAYVEYEDAERPEGRGTLVLLETGAGKTLSRIPILKPMGRLSVNDEGTRGWGGHGVEVDFAQKRITTLVSLGVTGDDSPCCGGPQTGAEFDHRCVSSDPRSRVEFERGTGRALRIIFRGVNGVDRIIDEGGASSSVVISGHSWSPDGTRLAYVFSDLQGTAHWTEARVYDFRSRRIVFWKEAAEEIRWAEGSRTLIAIVGNAGTKELETPGRRISVWANDAQVIDVETGSATCLIRDVSFTRGYDVTKAGNLPDPFDALCEAEVRTLLPNTMAWQGMREEHAAWIESNRLEALRITKLLAQTLDLSTRERLWTELRSPDIERVLCSARLLRAAGEERSNVAAAALVGSDRDAILNDYLDQGERLRRSERVPR